MAINIKFDLAGNPEPPTIILAKRNGDKLGQLYINEKSIELNNKFNDASELSFTLNKYIDEKITPLWDKVVDFKLIYCKEWDTWFEAKVELDEATETVKTVFCTQLGQAELSQIMLYGIEINTEKDIEREDYKISILYDKGDSESSILDRILNKAPHYFISHIDKSIASIQRSFSFDGTSIYDAFQEIAEEIGCLFVFHSNSDDNGKIRRNISVYDLQQNCLNSNCGHRGEFTDVCPKCGSTNIKYGYGKDTLIFVTSDELATDGIQLVTDVDAVKNCFKLEAGDDLMTATVRNCNPNGTDYIWHFSNSIKEDMSEELVDKIESYDGLYKEYYKDYEFDIDRDLLNSYNIIANRYSTYNEDLQQVTLPVKGHSSLMSAYYNIIDLALYLESGLMPSIEMSETSATEQGNLLALSLTGSSVAVSSVNSLSLTTADSAVLAMTKTIIKSTYKAEITSSEISEDNIWSGYIAITNHSDSADFYSVYINNIKINDDLETFARQKIEKMLSKENSEDYSISGLFKISVMTKNSDGSCTHDTSAFDTELTKYALSPLSSFYDACQSCIDILIAEGIGEDSDADLYNFYISYLNRLRSIETKIENREEEIADVKDFQAHIDEQRNTIKNVLDFEKYLGEDLWLEFCAYRREDKYSNENYISDGLNSVELFEKAMEFYEVAENEIYKSAELQHSISTTLNNLLTIPKFKPLIDSFDLGNWIRVRVDDEIYKLRLLEYDIDFGNFENIPVEFSDVTKIKNGITDIESILSQASTMATSYGSIQRQARQGNEAQNTVEKWLANGLNAALVQIQSNENEEITINNNGILGRSYNDITDSYSPEQIRITHNIFAYTDDNWETVRQAIGKHSYKLYDETAKNFVDIIGYGMSADFVTAGVVSGSQIIGGDIYSDNYSVTNSTGSYINLRDGTFSFGGGSLRYEGGKLLISSPNVLTTSQVTEINENYLKTTSVYAEYLQVNSLNINGQLTASQINTKGLTAEKLNCKEGTVGGWEIGDSYLMGTSDGKTTGFQIPSAGQWAIAVGSSSEDVWGDAPFKVDHSGNLTADSATITGNITATSGKIANWEISGNKLYVPKNDSNTYGIGLNASGSNDSYAFWAGYNGNGDSPGSINGESASDKTAFIVKTNGFLKASDADITGNVKANNLRANQCFYICDNDWNAPVRVISCLEDNTSDSIYRFGRLSKGNSENKHYIGFKDESNVRTCTVVTDNFNVPEVTSTGHIRTNNNLVFGFDFPSQQIKGEQGVGTYCADDNFHYVVKRHKDGLSCDFGIPGATGFSTNTYLRGTTCKLTNASGNDITSDERLKHDFNSLDSWEGFYSAIEPIAFKMNAGTSGRYHIGFKAQQIEKALLNNDLTTQDFGGLVKSTYVKDDEDILNTKAYEEAGINDGDEEYGLIYTEFIALNTHMIQKLYKKVADLEEKISQL